MTTEAQAQYDSVRQSLDSVPPEHRRAAQLEKSDRLFHLACRIQDELENIGIYYGDGDLLTAKKRIHDACERARATAYKTRYGRRS